MNILLVFAAICTLLYILLLSYYRYGWNPKKYFGKRHGERREHFERITWPFLSVVIPARNEAAHIAKCLQYVTQQDYPGDRYEVIVVNDGSEDDTEHIVNTFSSVRLVKTSGSAHGKKHALTLGIESARGEIIVTTDADCIMKDGWLTSVADTLDIQTMMTTGPVLAPDVDSAFDRFQSLELVGLAVVTASGIHTGIHHLANGANMAFRKTAFEAVHGFAGNTRYASGDDVFLAQGVAARFPGGIRYNWAETAVVYSSPVPSIIAFLQQRRRWATKNISLPEKSVFLIWVFVWVTFVLNVAAFISALFHSLGTVCVSAGLITVIAISEYFFLKGPVQHFGIRYTFKHYWLSFMIHYVYVIVMGFSSVFGKKYQWKGRTVR